MKLGITVSSLGPNQLAYHTIKNLNLHLDVRPDLDPIVFYENNIRPCLPMNFASMQIYEAWGYDGIVVATSLSNAHKLLEFPASTAKFFYVWDLEWLRLQFKQYRSLVQIYRNPDLKLIARSESHKDIIEDCWNTKVVGVVDNLDMGQLLGIIENVTVK